MSDELALLPEEAAYIAANAYFVLEGWEATYQFQLQNGPKAKGAPAPRPGLEQDKIIRKNVTGSGNMSLANTGIENPQMVKAFEGSSGLNLTGRTRSGFGYILHFERGNKKHLVIATRGTRPEMGAPDLITDVNISTNRHMPGVGPVHAGFYDVYNSLAPTLAAAADMVAQADVLHCVGHSLGGAVANLVALHFAQRGANVRLYTFGAPRVGLRAAMYDKVAETYIGADNIYRVSHNFDPIPMIPVAPYIHALPSVKDANNIFIGSPVQSIDLQNHDTGLYLDSVRDKNWAEVREDKLKEGYLNKQYFTSWRTSDSWLKQYIGNALNARMATLQRILQGLIDTVGIGLTEIATLLDLLSIAIRRGVEIYQVAKSHVLKFIGDCARMFGMAVDISKDVLSKLLKKLMTELAIAAKMALAKAAKVAKSKEFRIVLATATAGSIGVMLI